MLYEVMSLITNTIAAIFNALDNAMIEDNISMLDIFLALYFLDLVVWFVQKLMGAKPAAVAPSGDKK